MPPAVRDICTRGVTVLALGVLALGVLLCCPAPGRAQSSRAVRTFHVTRTPHPPVIDGRLTDEVWSKAEVLSQFTQQDPDEGQPATEQTEIRLLYDDQALYVGAHMF